MGLRHEQLLGELWSFWVSSLALLQLPGFPNAREFRRQLLDNCTCILGLEWQLEKHTYQHRYRTAYLRTSTPKTDWTTSRSFFLARTKRDGRDRLSRSNTQLRDRVDLFFTRGSFLLIWIYSLCHLGRQPKRLFFDVYTTSDLNYYSR